MAPTAPNNITLPRRKRRDWSGAGVGLFLGLAGLLVARLGWLRIQLDVFSAFTIQFAILTLASGISLLLPRFKSLAASLLFVIGIVAYGLWPSLTVGADGPTPPGTKRLRVATYNLDTGQGREAAVAASLAKLDADVLVLTEYDGTVPAITKAVTELYPFMVPCEDFARCDVAIASRMAITRQEGLLLGDASNAVAVRLGAEYGNVLIAGVHTARFPRSTRQFAQMETLAQRLAQEAGPMIVAGDFNATAQSRVVQNFARSLDLNIGVRMPTYPTAWGLPQLAIDQILVRTGIVPIGPETTGDGAGSDHVPIVRSFAVPLAQ